MKSKISQSEGTVLSKLKKWVKNNSGKNAYTFLTNGSDEVSLTYGELDKRAKAIALQLAKSCKKGDRALLLFPSGLDFISAFFGCLYAGVIAVPAYPPKKNRKMERLNLIIDDCNAATILSAGKTFDNSLNAFRKNEVEKNFNWIKVDDIEINSTSNFECIDISPEDVSFLQYTSGSTGNPKGVVVTHRNLFANSQLIYDAMGHSRESVVVSWLPLFHDMGLIGGMIQSLFAGGSTVIMAPETFLLKPVRWFEAISKYKATATGAPNFAYDLCVKSIDDKDLDGLDLSSLKIAFSGAEPVLAETLENFSDRFNCIGFDKRMFYPCYGMAETTLMVTGPNAFTGYRELNCDKDKIKEHKVKLLPDGERGKRIIGCGYSWNDHCICIVNPHTHDKCSQGSIGEIWISGESVADGYWNKQDSNREVFNAYINNSEEGPFLRTGDMGVILDDELYITGRLKDVVIIRGKNHYPQDIESTIVSSHEALLENSSAVFSVEKNGEEKLIAVQELKRSYTRTFDGDEITQLLSANIFKEHGILIHSVLLLKPYSIPKTSSGKIQRSKCKDLYLDCGLDFLYQWNRGEELKTIEIDDNSEKPEINREFIDKWLQEKLSRLSSTDIKSIDRQKPFSTYGLDSVSGLSLVGECQDLLQLELPVSIIYDYPTIEDMSSYLWDEYRGISNESCIKESLRNSAKEDIAIIGMECCFPGAGNCEEYWQLLKEGRDAITEIPESRWDWKEHYTSEVEKGKMNTRWGGFLNDIDEFDASFFNITPIEAMDMDPQHRILLEQTYKTLENSGYTKERLDGSDTGVFVGIGNNDYGSALKQKDLTAYLGTGNSMSIAANRLSYTFNWKGPSIALDSACSSSLTAVHLACQSLKSGDCSMAIAGAVNLILTPELTIALSQAQMMASDGKCKTFDSKADGYVRSEGCGVVALKRLSDAERDGDHVLAVIEGSALVQDGRSNGLTSPNGRSQQEVIVKALNSSGRRPEEISFVETHGTGTSLGDPIEIQALYKTYGVNRNKPLIIGSVKANIGHLEVCAGMAGLIKTVLCLEHKVVPPQLHIDKLNPHVNWRETSLAIPQEHVSLNESGIDNITAGVSSFGFGGTNSHLIVSSGRKTPSLVKKAGEYTLLPISAESEESLRSRKKEYIEFLSNDGCSYSISATASIHRDHYSFRDFYVADNIENLKLDIKSSLNNDSKVYSYKEKNSTAFLFSGQGSQYKGMGKDLYGKYSVFTNVLDQCADILKEEYNIPLFDIMWGEESESLYLTEYTQPALFSLEAALASMWLSFGVEPDVLIGHSLGEFSAAFIAGVFSLKDALKLVCARGKLMSAISNNGGMLSVLASIETVRSYIEKLDGVLEIAVLNGNKNIVIAGKIGLIEQISGLFAKDDIKHKKLDVSGAFHSTMMKPMVNDFRKVADEIIYSKPSIDIISNVSGMLHKEFNSEYWVKHIEATVLFTSGMDVLKDMNIKSFVEIGPSSTLLGLLAGYLPYEPSYIPSLCRKLPSQKRLLLSLGTLYKNGASIKWDMIYSESYEKVKLPSYPFNKKRYWKIDNNIQSINRSKKDECKKVFKKVENVEERLKGIIKVISGIEPEEIKDTTDLMTLGLDSLMLVQFRKKITETFSLEISIEKFLMDLTTIEKISDYIKNNTIYEEEEPVEIVEESHPDIVKDGVYNLLNKKLDIMKDITKSLNQLDSQISNIDRARSELKPVEKRIDKKHEKINFRTYQFDDEDLTRQQEKFISELINRYVERTKASKEYNSRLRKDCSHWLSSLNFRMVLKEILYPIIARNGEGAYFTDIDGNEYLDFAMGYGSHFFGHKPEFITNAIKSQLDEGYVLTPHMNNLEEASSLFKKITGVERLTFCNTGSEAVMFAIRLARTYTGKKKIVKFAGSYHGVYDAVLAENIDDNLTPLCSGITDGSFEDTEVLLYGSSESLDRLKLIKNEIAAVLVEPVQSRRPGLQPGEFLKELRAITSDSDSVLIFDEMITGFRIHPGGAQAYFGVEADLVTYGKIVGGGMPIGIVAGRNKLMNCVDGGDWNYGDKSIPESETTFIAGTFANHPVTVASMTAALREIDSRGMQLYEKINAVSDELAKILNEYFQDNYVPIKIRKFGSLFRFESYGKYDLAFNPIEMDLFFYLLKEKGVYVWERKICFLSTKHTLADIEKLRSTVVSAVTEIREGGFPFSTGEPSGPGNEKKSDTDVIPMTSAQKRMYTLSLLDGGDLPYHITDVKRVKGILDIDLLKKAIREIVNRHDSLRTSFFTDDGNFFQRIHTDFELEVKEVSLDESDIKSTVSGFITQFDLSQPTQMRVLIGKIKEDDYILVLDFHHIVVDGYSASVLAMELMTLYKGNTLSDVGCQSDDYLRWEQEFINSSTYAKQKDYWCETFKDKPEPLNLPLDSPRSGDKTFDGKTITSKIGREICAKVKSKSSALGITPYNFLLTSLNFLLAKLTGQNDISLGTPVAIRDQGDFEKTVGMLTNTIVLRNKIDSEKSFSELAKDIKKNFITSFINKEFLFEDLIQELKIKPVNNRNPLFDVSFIYENGSDRIFTVDGLEFSRIDYFPDISMFDISFEFIEENDEMQFNINYDSTLFNETTITKWKKYFNCILNSVLSDTDISINDLDIISNKERRLILEEFNNTQKDYPTDKTVIEKFEEQVGKNPDSIAVVYEEKEITYRELDEQANIVGNYLRDNYNADAGDTVGVMLPRSERMLSVLLGILKSGAAYIPIDPDYPQERVHYIIKDSKPTLIIDPEVAETIFKSEGKRNPVKSIKQTDSPIYIIYTSGTTGLPKGTIITNNNFNNYISWAKEYYFNGHDMGNFSLFTSLSFDLTTTSIYLTLLRGKTITVYSQESDIRDILYDTFSSSITDSVKLTPSHISLLKDMDIKDCNISLAIVGGEELLNYQVKILKELNNQMTIINEYGPTETTVGCIVKQINDSSEKILIGKPISNTRIYILDKYLKPVPLGVTGEIFIGGRGVGLGYVNRADLTQQKFVKNPFIDGEKIYRSGDLGRWLENGDIEFLGRIDDQVKIRGHRIELGEIENVMLQHLRITKAAVVVDNDIHGDKFIAAYYVSESLLETKELKRFMKLSLPDYMLPSFFTLIDDIPLTTNGKLDRSALPKPDMNSVSGAVYAAPVSPVEEKLAGIWQDVLGIKRIGIHDDFFDLGGHSLKATSAVSRILKTFEVKLDLKDVFENPTIETLSKVIERSADKIYKQIESVEVQDSYEVSSSQRRLWILDRLEENSLAYNMPACLLLEGEFDEMVFSRSFSYLVERHESLRTVFIDDNDGVRQVILDNVDPGINYIDLSNNPEKDSVATNLIKKDFEQPFNLANGPLIRISVLKLDERKHLMIFNMHHIISDGWSINIFTNEFFNVYNCYKESREPKLEPLSIQYKDYSAWQNKLLVGRELDSQKKYWSEKLSGELPVLNLHGDYKRPKVKSYNGKSIHFNLSEDIVKGIRSICSSHRVSLFMVLQSLLKVLLFRYTGQSDIIVGSPVAGRNHEDLENQIGLFVNTLALRDILRGESKFTDILSQVKETCTSAFDNQDYPFDQIVSDLDIKKNQSRSPIFDIMLVLQNNDTRSKTGFKGLNVLPFETENHISKFDITFNFIEVEECLTFEIEYNSDIYSHKRIMRMAEHYKCLAESAYSCPDSRISDLNIVTDNEKKLLLDQFNDTKTEYDKEKNIIQFFQEQVEKNPDKVAVIYEKKLLTYKELDELADSFAYSLCDNGVVPGDLVGLKLYRSEKLIAALLGIIKSGAAYVPIDPDYPEDRIDYIISDSNPKMVIDESNVDDFAGYKGEKFDLSGKIKSDSLIYIIYTSGTTGLPKGSKISHNNFNNYISWGINYYFDDEISGNFGLFTSLSFDLTTTSIYLALLRGKTLTVFNQNRDVNDILMEIFNSGTIDSVKLTPSHIALLKDSEIIRSNVNLAIVGGEELLNHQVKILRDINSNIRVVNEYGPTETTVGCIVKDIDRAEESIVIGKPIANTRIYILDNNLNLLPPGIPGEIYIGGEGVGLGYLNKSDLSKSKFINNPLGIKEKIYRSGDLGSWLENGDIDYLGRIDDQVKINGHRIELGEIENTLLQIEGVTSSAVTVCSSNSGEKSLAAYYVSEKDFNLTEIRGLVGRTLPVYMIPSFFIKVDNISLTTNGKLDKRSLPDPFENGLGLVTEYSEPRNKTDELLVDIWISVLGSKRNIGIDDNFFEMGGDSIKAIQIVSRLSQNGLKGEVSTLFNSPTIRGFSESLKEHRAIIDQSPVTGDFPLTPIQKWFYKEIKISRNHFNQGVLLDINEDVSEFDVEGLKKAAAVLLDHHDALRLSFTVEGDVVVQESKENAELDFVQYDITGDNRQEEKIEEIAEIVQTGFDPVLGDLVKFILFKSRKGYRLLIIAHHLIIDGVSWRILIEDLETGYRQLKAGKDINLPFKTNSYKEWSEVLNDYVKGNDLKRDLNFWEDMIRCQIDELPLPDSIVPEKTESEMKLSKSDTNKLLTKSSQAFNTGINDVLLTSLSRALGIWSGNESIRVDLESHGRSERFGLDLSRTIGWFTSIYPVVLSLEKSGRIEDDIISIKERLRSIPDNGIGFGILKYLADPSPLQNRTSDIVFNYLGQLDSDVNTGLFNISTDSIGNSISPDAECLYKLSFNGGITSGNLIMTLESDVYCKKTLDYINTLFKRELKSVIDTLSKISIPRKTPSDLTFSSFKYSEYKKLLIDNGISDSGIQDIYNLTPLQQGFLFHSIMDQKSSTYFEQLSLDINGYMDVERFSSTWQKITDQYDVLRTMFIHDFRIPLQVVLKERNVDISYYDIRSEKNKLSKVNMIKADDRKNTFNLRRDNLFRIKVIKIKENQFTVIISFHHIILDGWSMSIVLSKFLELYKDPNIMFTQPKRSEYIKWLNNRSSNKGQLYWRDYLKGYESLSTVPMKNEVNNCKEAEHCTYKLLVSREQSNEIRRTANDLGVTLNSMIQAIWGILLSKYNGKNDVVFGATVSGRPNDLDRVEDMVGLFINTIPVRVKLDSNESFRDVVIDVQRKSLESLDYHYCSLADIQNISSLRNGLLDHTIAFENYPISESVNSRRFNDFEIANIESFDQVNYDFGIAVIPQDELSFEFSFNPGIYSINTIENISKHIERVISSVIDNRDISVKDIDIISEEEKTQLLELFNDTKSGFNKEKTIIEQFEDQVEKTPGAVAVIYESRKLTYQELNDKANILGHYLKDQYNVKPDDLIGVMLNRSEKMIISLLGVLKSGAAYIPIDPDYPKERVEFMIKDSEPKAIISEKSVTDTSCNGFLDIDEVLELITKSENPKITSKPENLIYVIYTSGTTGLPKGAKLSNHNFNNYINWAADYYFNDKSKGNFGLFTSLSFDLTATSIYLTLLRGNTLTVFNQKRDVSSVLLDMFRSSDIDSVKLTPSHISLLKDMRIQDSRISLAIVGGEELLNQQVKILKDINCDIKVVNEYGPTEATVGCIVKEINSFEEKITIGKPIANTRIYILGKDLNLLPCGASGEIYIGGESVGQGYINRPDLTGNKFLNDPFYPGDKMYRSGDLARWMDSGDIEFLGRIDDQVKVRGHRIELGEIENFLLKVDGINSAAVLVRTDKSGDKSLVAYYASDKAFLISELKELLGDSLPEYMVPSFFIRLDVLPLTTNGKVNKGELPDPGELGMSHEYAAPENSIEAEIAGVWAEILDLERVGVTDNFFEIGGHSLKALKSVSYYNNNGWEVTLNDVFQYPTIRELACYIKSYLMVDKNLVTDKTQALKNLHSEFNITFKYKELEGREGINCLVSDKDIDSLTKDKIALYIRDNFSKSLNPHYIISEGEELLVTDDQSVWKNLDLCKSMMLKFKSDVVSTKKTGSYPFSPVQKIHSRKKTHLSGTIAKLDSIADNKILEKAVIKLLKKHSILRSSICIEGNVKSFDQYKASEEIKLPVLSFRDCLLSDDHIKTVSDFIWSEEFVREGLAYNMVLIQLNLRENFLYMPANHLIFDEMSGEIVERDLNRFYKDIESGKDSSFESAPGYSEYVRDLSRVPSTVTESGIIDNLDMETFSEYQDLLLESINKSKRESVFISRFKVEMGQNFVEDDVWEKSFYIMNMLIKEYFNVTRIPVRLVNNGRMYKNNKYSNTIGEFLDLIPVLVDLNQNSKEVLNKAFSNLEYVKKNNINFLSLLYNEDSSRNMNRLSQLNRSDLISDDETLIMFNFQGKVNRLIESDIQRGETHLQVDEDPVRPACLLCDVSYDEENVYFTISQCFDSESERIEKLFNKVADEVITSTACVS